MGIADGEETRVNSGEGVGNTSVRTGEGLHPQPQRQSVKPAPELISDHLAFTADLLDSLFS